MTDPGDDPAPPTTADDLPDPPDPPQPEPPEPPAPPEPGRRGRRLVRSSDRYAGGVAGGIAEALDIDPIVVRLVLVVGALYLPLVVLLYALVWLVLPDERTGASLLAEVRTPDGWRPVAGIAALGIGVALLAPDLGPGGNGALTAGVLLAGAGALVLLRHPGDGDGGDDPAAASRPPAPEPPPGTVGPSPVGDPFPAAGGDTRRSGAPLERLVRQRLERRRRRRPPSHLGWLGVSALVVLVGVAAAVDRGIEPVAPGVAVSLGLLLIGAVLVVAAWRGRARLLVLPGLALLPLWVGFGLSDVPRYDHDGDARYTARTRDELRRSYEHGYGQMDVDLSQVELRPGEHRQLRIGLTAGQATLRVPAEARLVVRGDIGLGQVEVVSEGPYYGTVATSGAVVANDVDLRLGDPEPTCFEEEIFGPAGVDEEGNPLPPGVIGKHTITLSGEPCELEPPVEDPPTLEVDLDVGIGDVEVRRGTA